MKSGAKKKIVNDDGSIPHLGRKMYRTIRRNNHLGVIFVVLEFGTGIGIGIGIAATYT